MFFSSSNNNTSYSSIKSNNIDKKKEVIDDLKLDISNNLNHDLNHNHDNHHLEKLGIINSNNDKDIVKQETIKPLSKDIDKYIEELSLFDDEFMSIVFKNNYEVSQYVLNVIFDRDDIKVIKVESQKEYKSNKILGHSIILDIYALDSNKKAYDIEIQRANKANLANRARYYSALLDSSLLNKGQDYQDLKESYIIFITEKDVLQGNLAIYHIDRNIKELNYKPYNDGSHIIYINGAYQDENSKLGKLVHDLKANKVEDIYSDILKKHIAYYKESIGGKTIMGDTFERFKEDVAKAVAEETRKEVTNEVTTRVTNEVTTRVTNEVTNRVNIERIKSLMLTLKLNVEQALDALMIYGEERNEYLKILQSK